MKDLDIIHLIQTQRKLAAGLATIIQNDQTKIQNAKKLYYKEICIADHIHESEKHGFLSEKNEYLEFLQSNDKDEDTKFLEEQFEQCQIIRMKTKRTIIEKYETAKNSLNNSGMIEFGVEMSRQK